MTLPNLIEKIANIYIRVSSADQVRGHSLQNQLADCRDLLRRLGLKEGKVYIDVESAFKEDRVREHYELLIKDAKAGRCQALIVWKIDRFTRRSADGLQVLKLLLDELGVELYSVMERIDVTTADGRKNLRNLISEAEFESERLAERVMPGMRRGARLGRWQGTRHVYYGFRYDKPHQLLVEVPEEIKVLKVIYNLRKEGMAVYSITKRLYDMGIRNRAGRPFSTHQVEIMLKRSIYVDGIYHWNKEKSEKPIITPVIDKEIWDAVQVVNKNRKRESKAVSPGRVNSSYILQGILKCNRCGKNMVGQAQLKNHKTRERRPVYGCGLRAQRTCRACEGQYLRAEIAHDLAFDILKKVMQNSQLIEVTKRHLRTALENNQPHLSRRIHEVRALLHSLKQDQQKCRTAYYQEAITLQQFKEENLRLVREQETAEQELKTAELKLHGAELFKGKVDQVFDLLREFHTVWEKMIPVRQRIIYRGVFNFLKMKGKRKCLSIESFSLNEPFQSWYNGKIWNGDLVLTDEGNVFLANNSQQDKDLCEKSTFAHLAAK